MNKGREQIQTLCNQLGWIITGLYINMTTNLNVKCDKNHDIVIFPSQFLRYHKCPKCNKSNFPKDKIEDLNSHIRRRGWIMKGPYISMNKETEFECNNGHTIRMRPSFVKRNRDCSYCTGRSHDKVKKDFYDLAMMRNWEVLSRYSGTSNNICMKCPNNHLIQIKVCNFKKGDGCPQCNNQFIIPKFEVSQKQIDQYNNLIEVWEPKNIINENKSNENKSNENIINENIINENSNNLMIDFLDFESLKVFNI